jgi:hypothetical protein
MFEGLPVSERWNLEGISGKRDKNHSDGSQTTESQTIITSDKSQRFEIEHPQAIVRLKPSRAVALSLSPTSVMISASRREEEHAKLR